MKEFPYSAFRTAPLLTTTSASLKTLMPAQSMSFFCVNGNIIRLKTVNSNIAAGDLKA